MHISLGLHVKFCRCFPEDTMEKIDSHFKQQEEEFKARIKKHGNEVSRLWEKSQWQVWHVSFGSMGALATLACAVVVGRLAWLGSYAPEKLQWTNFVNQWYAPYKRDRDGNLKYEKIPAEKGGVFFVAKWVLSFLCATPMIVIPAAGICSLWSWCSLCQKKELETWARAEELAKKEFQTHQTMWQGVRMSVDAVQERFTKLAELSVERFMHREAAMKELGKSLWAMSMSMDEMMVWMEGRGCFPPNFSVQQLIGESRYDRFKEALRDARRPPQILDHHR